MQIFKPIEINLSDVGNYCKFQLYTAHTNFPLSPFAVTPKNCGPGCCSTLRPSTPALLHAAL